MRTLGVIPARGRSKRLPRKNILPLNGIPLIAYMIKASQASKLDRIIVSTEDNEIANIARNFGADVPFMRPAELAEDYAMDADILQHALDWVEQDEKQKYDIIVQLQPTTPFITPDTINACIKILVQTDANTCFAARATSEPPQWMFRKDKNGFAQPLLGKNIEADDTHTQLLEKTFIPNGGAFAILTDAFRKHKAVYVDPLRMVEMSWERSVDIDEDLDLLFAEAVCKKYDFRLIS